MADFVMKHAGANLLKLLQEECALTAPAARAFLEARSGVVFDPQADYCVSYEQSSAAEHWSSRVGLRIWIEALHPESVSSRDALAQGGLEAS